MMNEQLDEIADATDAGLERAPRLDAGLERAPCPDAGLTQASCLDERDMPYHRHIIAEVQQIAALEARVAAIRAASASWMAYLSPRYGLGTRGTVDAAGAIVRAAE